MCNKNVRANHWYDHGCKLSKGQRAQVVMKEKKSALPWTMCKCHDNIAFDRKAWKRHCLAHGKASDENVREQLTEEEYQRRLDDGRLKKPAKGRTKTMRANESVDQSMDFDDISVSSSYYALNVLGKRTHC